MSIKAKTPHVSSLERWTFLERDIELNHLLRLKMRLVFPVFLTLPGVGGAIQ